MKKLIITVMLILSVGSLFAYGNNDEEITWAEYEVLCYKNGVEPTWEQYEELIKNPQCLIVE